MAGKWIMQPFFTLGSDERTDEEALARAVSKGETWQSEAPDDYVWVLHVDMKFKRIGVCFSDKAFEALLGWGLVGEGGKRDYMVFDAMIQGLLPDIPDAPDLSNVALKSDLVGYVLSSALPDFEGFARKDDIPSAPDLSEYAKKADIPSAPDLSGFASAESVALLAQQVEEAKGAASEASITAGTAQQALEGITQSVEDAAKAAAENAVSAKQEEIISAAREGLSLSDIEGASDLVGLADVAQIVRAQVGEATQGTASIEALDTLRSELTETLEALSAAIDEASTSGSEPSTNGGDYAALEGKVGNLERRLDEVVQTVLTLKGKWA